MGHRFVIDCCYQRVVDLTMALTEASIIFGHQPRCAAGTEPLGDATSFVSLSLSLPLPFFLSLSLSLSHVRGAFSLITRHENLMAYNQCRIQANLQVAPPPFSPPSRAATASSCVKQQLPIPLRLSLHSPSHIRITYANLFILFILCHHVPPTCPLPFALSATAPSVPALLLSPCPSSTSSSLFFRLSSSASMCELWPFVCCFCLSFVCLFACLCVVCLPRMLTHSHTHTLPLPQPYSFSAHSVPVAFCLSCA